MFGEGKNPDEEHNTHCDEEHNTHKTRTGQEGPVIKHGAFWDRSAR